MDNKYLNTEIKWIVAQAISGGEWEIKYLGTGNCPNLVGGNGYHPIIDCCPAYKRNNSQFAVFKSVENWWERRAFRLIDFRDKSNWPIRANFSFLNQLDASWF